MAFVQISYRNISQSVFPNSSGGPNNALRKLKTDQTSEEISYREDVIGTGEGEPDEGLKRVLVRLLKYKELRRFMN